MAGELRRSPRTRRRRCGSVAVHRDELLARSGLVHLEHRDRRGPRGDRRPAEGAASPTCSREPSRSRVRRPRPAASSRAGSPSRPAVGRGRGHVRLKDGKAWTLLTALTELKGFEETGRPDAATRAPSTASSSDRETWPTPTAADASRARRHDQPALCADRRRRAGRHRARRPAEAARRPDPDRRSQCRGPAMPGAIATSRSACTIRSGTTICPTCRFPTTGRSSRPRTRWPTGWRSYAQVMELDYWGSTAVQAARRTTTTPANGRSTSSATDSP